METLFDRGRLISTSFGDHFPMHLAQTYAHVLRVAMLSHAALLPEIRGFDLRGRGGVTTTDLLVANHHFELAAGDTRMRLPGTWLSHGYQATIAWLADLVGHILWEASEAGRRVEFEPTQMQGLVLIDELDLHLHPAWQVGLIAALKQTLPRMQFVVTTHSPMLLSGLEQDEIIVLEQDPQTGDVVPRTEPRAPKLQTSGELLEHYFGVDELDPTQLSVQFSRFGFLANNPFRSDADEAEMQRLLDALRRGGVAPEWDPVPRSQQ
jgi:hypothetical protein